MKSTNPQNVQRPSSSDLDSRYGAIGIPAVAAALQYKGEIKTPAAAPTVAQPAEKWLGEIAA
jgi:hypothetical protein